MSATPIDAPTVTGDGLAAELLARRRKRLPKLTVALAVLAVAAAAFIGGIEVNKHWGASSNSATGPAAFAGRFANGAARGGLPSFAGGGGSTSGTVTLIKGSTLYVTDATGNTVLVHTSASSQVSKTVGGTLKAVHPGDTVTVVGPQAADGSYTARQVTIGDGNG